MRVQPGNPPGIKLDLPVLEKNYIVAELQSVYVHDDHDGVTGGAGDVFIVAGGGTGEPGDAATVSTSNFPIHLWREIYTRHGFNVSIPLLVRPESEMRDNLELVVSVMDNDEYPGWLDGALPPLGGLVGGYIAADLIGPAARGSGASAGGSLVEMLLDAIGESEMIGTMVRWHSRDLDEWGLSAPDAASPGRCASHSVRAGDVTVRYRVRRIPALHGGYRAFVTLDRIEVRKDGDDGKGEIYAHVRVGNGIDPPVERRFPGSGTVTRDDGEFWDIGELVYSGPSTPIPVLYVEVDAWDEDNADVGDDDDTLGIATWAIDLVDLDLPLAPGERRDYPLAQLVRNPDRVNGQVMVELTLTLLKE